MGKLKKFNALTVAIVLCVIIMLSCSVVLILHNEFDLMLGDKKDNVGLTIELAVRYDGYVDIRNGEHLYLSDSRESLGWVNSVEYDHNGTMLVTVSANGLKSDGSVMLNGSTYIAKGTLLSIMNNKIEVEVLNII